MRAGAPSAAGERQALAAPTVTPAGKAAATAAEIEAAAAALSFLVHLRFAGKLYQSQIKDCLPSPLPTCVSAWSEMWRLLSASTTAPLCTRL